LLDESILKDMPWSTILLLGGSFAIAAGFSASGLTECISSFLSNLSNWHYFFLLLLICGMGAMISELTSNVATCTVLLPIASSLAVHAQINPLALCVPLTFSCSLSFALPISTPPNAIAYSTGYFTVLEMAKNGLVLNFIGILVVPVLFYAIGFPVYNIDLESMPDWATN